MRIEDAGLQEPSDEPPDISGEVATCPTCGTSVGPLTASGVRSSVVVTCPCGNRLEAWA